MARSTTFFITGTDTDAGKTLSACAILAAARDKGLSTAAVKPVAAGVTSGGINADVLALAAYCSPLLETAMINPVCFNEPIAPHIAAARSDRVLRAGDLARHCEAVMAMNADITLIEGAGGWKVPVNEQETLADMAVMLGVPVILVVGMRLGCLNHALLTAQAIQADGLPLAGWIANSVDADMAAYADNLLTLAAMLPAPLLAEIPRLGGDDDSRIAAASALIDLEQLLQP